VLALLLSCAPAQAQSGPSGADRLRITPRRDQVPFDVRADATATGTVARRGDFDAATLPSDRYTARLLVTTLPRTRHCRRSTPRADTPHTDVYTFYETRFSEVLDISDASEVARKLRLCGYLTAKRRTPSGVRTVTVARASTTVSAPVQQKSSEEPSWAVRFIAWIITLTLFGWLIVGLIRLVKWWIHDTPAARKARRAATARRLRRLGRSAPSPPPAAPAPSYAVPASPPPQSAPMTPSPPPAPMQTERPRRRAKPRDVVLDAVDAVADTYRDRLQTSSSTRMAPAG
jgi:pyruvate/2-oxoglutarate dehydrogenase complex dihydrolipoamide acyltransferase (E2) component